MSDRPNVLFIMTDQQRFDTIAGLGNEHIYTPNFDRLARRGIAFTNAYSTCPVCVPARYTIRTGCEPPTLRIFSNRRSEPVEGQAATMEGRCGDYLARTMHKLGYRTFGIGKFHTQPWDEDLGYEVHLHSEELYGSTEQRRRDGFAGWLEREHPEFGFVETLMGERTEMYYMPQASPLPAEFTVERWAADRAVEQLAVEDERPFFGFVSFIGPHPPFAPPVPFNRMYDPDRMPKPLVGDIETDHMDEFLPNHNYLIWSDDISDGRAQVLKARYYGEISYIDDCLGRILDAVDGLPDGDNTLICFFADHGDHMGDHHCWQKESFFEQATHVPFLVSWPNQIGVDQVREELVCLTDLFGIATRAAGAPEMRDGADVLGAVAGEVAPRPFVAGLYGEPGTIHLKVMIRDSGSDGPEAWKYIYLANGGREQLFDVRDDPHELSNLAGQRPEVVRMLRTTAVSVCDVPGARDALDPERRDLKAFEFTRLPRRRIYQFDRSRGVSGFPDRPEDALKAYRSRQQD